MTPSAFCQRAISSADAIDAVFSFFSSYRDGVADKDVRADLTFGNPREMPLPAMVAAIKARMEPKCADWFAYKTSEEEPRTVIAEAPTVPATSSTSQPPPETSGNSPS